MSNFDDEALAANPVVREVNGYVITTARPKTQYFKTRKSGKVHICTELYFRWNHFGGTYDKPVVTLIELCGHAGGKGQPRFEDVIWVSRPMGSAFCKHCQDRLMEAARRNRERAA